MCRQEEDTWRKQAYDLTSNSFNALERVFSSLQTSWVGGNGRCTKRSDQRDGSRAFADMVDGLGLSNFGSHLFLSAPND